MVLGETVLAGFVESFVSSSLPPFPVLCNVSVYMNMNLICFSRIKKLLIESHKVCGLQAFEMPEEVRGKSRTGPGSRQQGAALVSVSALEKLRDFPLFYSKGGYTPSA